MTVPTNLAGASTERPQPHLFICASADVLEIAPGGGARTRLADARISGIHNVGERAPHFKDDGATAGQIDMENYLRGDRRSEYTAWCWE
jgi:hypothetical protein